MDTASVRAIRDKQAQDYETGVDEGYSAPPNMLPDFFYKPYINFTPRQRGWVFGRGLARYEWENSHPIAPLSDSC